MKKEELLHILALLNSEGVGDVLAKKLITQFGSATAVFSKKNQIISKISGIGAVTIRALKDKNNFVRAEREIEFINKNNIEYSYFKEKEYPAYLNHCFDAPVLIFKKGNINFKEQKIISIVGTRQITNYGKSVLDELFQGIKEYNPIIVSGFAYGVDIYAHKLAIKHNLQTIAVLAHGLDRIYPSVHKKYVKQLTENGG